MATMNVKDASGATVAIEKPLVPGQAAAAASRPVTLSTENVAVLSAVVAELIAQNETVGGIADTAYSGGNATVAAMIRAVADAAISQAAASTKEEPSAPFHDPDITSTPLLVTGSPAVLTGYMVSNPHATDLAALLFFDAATAEAVSLGTTPPVWACCLHGEDGADVPKNILFSNGIVVAAIKNFTGSTAPTTALPASVSFRAP